MSNKNINLLKETIKDADLVLIGIGEEWSVPDQTAINVVNPANNSVIIFVLFSFNLNIFSNI